MLDAPTARQQAVLDLIAEHRTAWGRAPSYSEIGHRMGIGRQAVAEHVGALRRKGLIPYAVSGIAKRNEEVDNTSNN